MRWNSPYINHFTQPDTIIPNPYNSQSWNRYAYVSNNPVNATDPTGHQCVGEPGECLEDDGTTGPGFPGTGGTVSNPGAGNCSGAGCQGNGEGSNYDEKDIGGPGGDPIDPLEGYTLGYCWDFNSLVGCTQDGIRLYMGEEPLDIDSEEFNAMMLYLISAAHGSGKWDLVLNAYRFDTPFYDESLYGIGRLDGTGCINGECSARHEINYSAQGVLWARVGVSKPVGHIIVATWKLMPIGHWPGTASEKTFQWFDYGYDAYTDVYPP